MDNNTISNEAVRKAGAHWTQRDINRTGLKRWYNFPQIQRHVNQKVCGDPIAGRGAGFRKKLSVIAGTNKLSQGISIGCGDGNTEMKLIEDGVVERFDLFEASEGRIKSGLALAESRGLTKHVNFNLVDGTGLPDASGYDLVYWKAALHHMFDVRAAVNWSREALAVGGVFAMDEYVGPDRFQWAEASLSLCNKLRAIMPDYYFPDVNSKRLITRPSVEQVIRSDPTEAVESSKIIPAVKAEFPNGDITITGGAIYHLALRSITNSIPAEEIPPLIDLILEADDLLANLNDYHFAVCLAQRT